MNNTNPELLWFLKKTKKKRFIPCADMLSLDLHSLCSHLLLSSVGLMAICIIVNKDIVQGFVSGDKKKFIHFTHFLWKGIELSYSAQCTC